MVLAHEVLDPAHHRTSAQPITRRPAGVVLDIEHAREGDAIAGPVPAVLDEVLRLCGARRVIGVGEVVGPADEVRGGGAVVVGGEGGVDVSGGLGGFDDDEARAGGVGALEVHVGLVVGDVEARDAGALL